MIDDRCVMWALEITPRANLRMRTIYFLFALPLSGVSVNKRRPNEVDEGGGGVLGGGRGRRRGEMEADECWVGIVPPS